VFAPLITWRSAPRPHCRCMALAILSTHGVSAGSGCGGWLRGRDRKGPGLPRSHARSPAKAALAGAACQCRCSAAAGVSIGPSYVFSKLRDGSSRNDSTTFRPRFSRIRSMTSPPACCSARPAQLPAASARSSEPVPNDDHLVHRANPFGLCRPLLLQVAIGGVLDQALRAQPEWPDFLGRKSPRQHRRLLRELAYQACAIRVTPPGAIGLSCQDSAVSVQPKYVEAHRRRVAWPGRPPKMADPQAFSVETVQELLNWYRQERHQSHLPPQPVADPFPGRKTLNQSSATIMKPRRSAQTPGRQRRESPSRSEIPRLRLRRDPQGTRRAGGPGLRWFWSLRRCVGAQPCGHAGVSAGPCHSPPQLSRSRSAPGRDLPPCASALAAGPALPGCTAAARAGGTRPCQALTTAPTRSQTRRGTAGHAYRPTERLRNSVQRRSPCCSRRPLPPRKHSTPAVAHHRHIPSGAVGQRSAPPWWSAS